MKRYGCKRGLPHDLHPVHETKAVKIEVCHICNKKFRWNKGYRQRIANNEYLEAHARNYCQPNGRTKALYMKIYQPEQSIIKL
jgi:hypothetical protein